MYHCACRLKYCDTCTSKLHDVPLLLTKSLISVAVNFAATQIYVNSTDRLIKIKRNIYCAYGYCVSGLHVLKQEHDVSTTVFPLTS
jgi:hypothetical protein